jgi:flagellar biosynthesis/type III secretory pathway M-ring protein FliF/YscJ
MSLSVLVDQAIRWEGQGSKMHRVLEQPSPEKLKSIRDLVAAATGFSVERGDQLIVESLAFESTLNLEPPQVPAIPKPSSTTNVNLPPWLARALENRTMLSGVALAVGFIVVMVRRTVAKMLNRKSVAKAGIPAGLPSADAAANSQVDAQRQAQLALDAELQAELNAAAMNEATLKTEVLLKRFRDSINKDSALAAHIVRGWLNESS